MTDMRRGGTRRDGEPDALDRGAGLPVDDLPQIVWTAQPDGSLVRVNARWRAYTGRTAADPHGRVWAIGVHPADRPSGRERWRQAVARGEPYEIACRLRRADGVYRWHLRRATPARDRTGRLTRWVGIDTDIHDQKTSEESQRAAILDTALDAIITMDASGRIVAFNPAAVRIFGYPQAAALGQNLADLIIPPELREAHRAGLATYLRTGTGPLIGRRREVTAIRADGAAFPVELAITRVPGAGPPLFTGYLRDISERVRAEAERAALLARVQERAAQLDATVEAITDAVVVVDAAARIIRANDAVRVLFGVDIAALVARDPSDEPVVLYTPLDDHGQPLPRAEWPRYRILQGAVLTGAHGVDTHAVVRDGRTVQLNVTGAPLRAADGHIIGGVMVMRDVTERRRLEQRTRAALDALLAMAEILIAGSPPDAAPADPDHAPSAQVVAQRVVALIRDVLGCRRVSLSTLDAATGTLRPLAITGLSLEEERLWRGRPAPPRLDMLDPALVARLHAGEAVAIALDAPPYRTRPNPFGARVVLAALLRIGTQPVGLLALDHGRTDHAYTPDERAVTAAVAKLAAVVIERDRLLRERADARASAAALREANRRMDDFVGIAGHEMRTPLTTTKGNLQLARRRLSRVLAHAEAETLARGLAAVQDLLERSETQLRRLERLVDDVLDIAHIQAGHLPIHRAPCDLAALVRGSVEEQRRRVPGRTILLEATDDQAIPLLADADRLGQVLTNYLTNALKYSDSRQPVTVGLAVTGAAARVWVRDAGPGIAPDDQDRIWERFYRVAATEHQSGSSVGLGLGLHICRTIIERQGGQVGVESAPGQGATFWFTLPLQGDD